MTEITLLDGGMGQELILRSKDEPTPLWSTHVMHTHPGLVAEIHDSYRKAGATVQTANTYAILRDRLKDTHLEDHFEDLYRAALAEVAGPGRIAGSIGPLRASYRPDLHPSGKEAVTLYKEVVALLAPSVDLILYETVASIAHAKDALSAAEGCGNPIWLAMTVNDDDGTQLRSGEPLADALAVTKGADALLINCSTPEVIPPALDILATQPLPFGAYANGFEKISDGFLQDNPTVDALSSRRDLSPDAYADHAMGWIAQGATIVGGCCEVGPSHIAAMAKAITNAGHTIV